MAPAAEYPADERQAQRRGKLDRTALALDPRPKHKPSLLVWVASTVCFLFGVAHILNVHPIGDGVWFWYATLWRQHVRLYADMHLSLQPLFPELTALFQTGFGSTWLAMKVLPVLQLATYTVVLTWLCRRASDERAVQACLVLGVFFLTITSPFYRFDDYHVTSDVLQLLVLVTLLLFTRKNSAHTITAVLAGLFCGLCTANRLNDGTMLFLTCVLCTAFLVRTDKLFLLLLETAGALAGLVLPVLVSRDTLGDWFAQSVLHAAKIKGGTGNVLLAPLSLPFRALSELVAWRFPFFVAYFLGVGVAVAYGPAWFAKGGKLRMAASVLLAILVIGTVYMARQSLSGRPVALFSSVAAATLFPLALLILFRAVRHAIQPTTAHWHRGEILLLLPVGQLLAGAMTSATSLPDLYPPVAAALLVAPLAVPAHMRQRMGRFLAGICLVIAASTAVAKAVHPYFWHLYDDHAMFRDRQWYRHPVYGPMYIERGQLAVSAAICQDVHRSDAPTSMLNLPYPYLNYFCGIPPWQNYIQTWYDTSGADTITALQQQLRDSPPEWIVYQHDPEVIRVHEAVFHGGQPLPHRYLDQQIVRNLQAGLWTVQSFQCYRGSDWILIHTRPGVLSELDRTKLKTRESTYCLEQYHKEMAH